MSIQQSKPEPLAVPQTEAGRLLSVCTKTIYELRRTGELPSFKVGTGKKSKVLIPMAAIKQFVERNSATPQPA